MNRRKNLLCVFFLVLTVLTCAVGVDVSAANGGSSEASSQPPGEASSLPPQSSEAPSSQPDRQTQGNPVSSRAASSKPASSSRSSSKAVRRRASSSPVSSEIASGESSDVFSWESSAAESAISLPGVGSVAENDPLSSAITNPEQAHRMNIQGLLAWACIGLGVLVVLIVVLSNRRPPRGPGRKRYRRQKRGSGKHLLNDRYYRDLNRY